MEHLNKRILLSCKKKKKKKKENFTLCDSMYGFGEHYAERNEPIRGRQILHNFSHMWNLMNKLNEQGKKGTDS